MNEGSPTERVFAADPKPSNSLELNEWRGEGEGPQKPDAVSGEISQKEGGNT